MKRLLLLTIISILLIPANLFWGAVHIPMDEVWRILTTSGDNNEAARFIVLESRLPNALTALTAGASLAAAGLMLQTLFRNPLAGPSILGITSGASLGAAIVILFFGGLLSLGADSVGGTTAIMTGAFAGSFAVLGILILFSKRLKSNLTLLIIGMMIGYLTSSLVTLLSSVSTAKGIQSYVMWGMGTFSGLSWEELPVFIGICLTGLLISLLLVKPLNLLLLGDNYAANLGVNIKRVRLWLLVSTGILSSIVTAACGPIGFIGLAMPHIARLIFRTDDHRYLLPGTMLCGSILGLACNLVSVMPMGNVIPINALTPIAGVPVVLYIILRKRSRQ